MHFEVYTLYRKKMKIVRYKTVLYKYSFDTYLNHLEYINDTHCQNNIFGDIVEDIARTKNQNCKLDWFFYET